MRDLEEKKLLIFAKRDAFCTNTNNSDNTDTTCYKEIWKNLRTLKNKNSSSDYDTLNKEITKTRDELEEQIYELSEENEDKSEDIAIVTKTNQNLKKIEEFEKKIQQILQDKEKRKNLKPQKSSPTKMPTSILYKNGNKCKTKHIKFASPLTHVNNYYTDDDNDYDEPPQEEDCSINVPPCCADTSFDEYQSFSCSPDNFLQCTPSQNEEMPEKQLIQYSNVCSTSNSSSTSGKSKFRFKRPAAPPRN